MQQKKEEKALKNTTGGLHNKDHTIHNKNANILQNKTEENHNLENYKKLLNTDQ